MKKIWRAGFTRRWHRNADMADTSDPVSGHSAPRIGTPPEFRDILLKMAKTALTQA